MSGRRHRAISTEAEPVALFLGQALRRQYPLAWTRLCVAVEIRVEAPRILFGERAWQDRLEKSLLFGRHLGPNQACMCCADAETRQSKGCSAHQNKGAKRNPCRGPRKKGRAFRKHFPNHPIHRSPTIARALLAALDLN
ncbi:hypothetical protein D3C86_1824010 [compost metagenome]